MEQWHCCPRKHLHRERHQGLCFQAAGSNAYAYTDCKRDCDFNSHIYSYFHCDRDPDFNSNSDCYCDLHSNYDAGTQSNIDTYSYSYQYTQAESYCQAKPDSTDASHPSTAAWGVIDSGAHASRMLVSASRRNELYRTSQSASGLSAKGKLRDGEDAIASTRDARATPERH